MTITSSRTIFSYDETIRLMSLGLSATNQGFGRRRSNGSVSRIAMVALLLGLGATAVCLAAEFWVVFRLLAVLPEGNADPVEIQHLADIGKWIAGATGATLLVRWFLDRAARAGHISIGRVGLLLIGWLAVAAGIYQSLQIVTDAIVDSLPAAARQDALFIALYRKNVQDGSIGDPDFGTGGTLDDLQRVKTVNAAIGLLDRERDYARRSESVIRDATSARKAEIVAAGQREVGEWRTRMGLAIDGFSRLAGDTAAASDAVRAAWTAYRALWDGVGQLQAQQILPPGSEHKSELLQQFLSTPPADDALKPIRDRLSAALAVIVVPPQPALGVDGLRLEDIPADLSAGDYGRFIADALGTRRDAGVWTIEDRVLTALEAVNQAVPEALPQDAQRRMVMSVVVPPLALSFGVVGIIANTTALFLLVLAVGMAVLGRARAIGMRAIRLSSVVLPWVVVAGAILLAPPVPFTDGQGFSRIAQQAYSAEGQIWTNLWLRMIAVEAELLGR